MNKMYYKMSKKNIDNFSHKAILLAFNTVQLTNNYWLIVISGK